MVREQQSVGRGLMALAAVIVLLGGMYLAASFVSFVLLAVFFALLCHPLKLWLVHRGVPPLGAMALIALGLTMIVGGLGLLVGASLGQLVANLDTYRDMLVQQSQDLRASLGAWGVAVPEAVAGSALNPEAIIAVFSSIIASIAGFLTSFVYLLILIILLLVEGPEIYARAGLALGADHPVLARLRTFSPTMVRYFGLRTYLNAMTGLGVGLALFLLGIDYAPLWGVLLFFLSYVPYIGIFVASIPPVVLALAEYGLGRALLVVVGITVVNLALENVIFPRMVGKGLSLSTTVVFLSFFVWSGLLGAAGALLAMFLTVLVLLLLDSYDETRWLARLLTPERAGDDSAPAGSAAPGAPPAVRR